MIKPCVCKVGTMIDSSELTSYVINLHYDKWDTEGIEESNLPERICKNSSYILAKIPIYQINEPDFYIDKDKVNEYTELSAETIPPVVLEKNNNHSYHIIDGCHRLSALVKMNKKEILAYIPYERN